MKIVYENEVIYLIKKESISTRTTNSKVKAMKVQNYGVLILWQALERAEITCSTRVARLKLLFWLGHGGL